MKVTIQGHSAGEIRQYRTLKLMLGIALLPLAYTSLSHREPGFAREERLVPQPVVINDDAMRVDFPLWWATGGRGPLRKIGRHDVRGRGPANADVLLYDENTVVGRTKTNRSGAWRTTVTISKPGLRAYRADFKRGNIAMGHSRTLGATILDPAAERETDVRITNFSPRNRVVAGRFTLRGSAPPGDFVQVYVDATLLGRAEVDLAGRWSFKPRIRTGGRRTFTIVDEITTHQFGPLPLIVVGTTPPKKPMAKGATAKGGATRVAPKPKGAKAAKSITRAKSRPLAAKKLPKKTAPKPKAKGKSRSGASLR